MTLAAAALLFAACDKIEPDADGRYVEYAGATAIWTETAPLAEAVQRAFVEKYTGPRCSNCPNADNLLDNAHEALGDKLVMVSITPSWGDGVPFSGQPDMSTPEGDQWATIIGGGTSMALPFGKLNRTKDYNGAPAFTTVQTDAQEAMSAGTKVALDVTATAMGNTVGIDVTVDFRQDVNKDVSLTLVLTEDSLKYKQHWAGHSPALVNDYVHNHMLRDIITDVWGVDVPVEGKTGETLKGHFDYTLPEEVVKANCHIVAFISEKESRKIINCDESDIQ